MNALITGVIWAGWHIPYYLFFLDRASLQAQIPLSAPALILTSFLILPLHALAYGELRLISKSVWPVWLLHTVSNAISLALVLGSFVKLSGGFDSILLSPTTEGIVFSLLMALTGWALYKYRTRTGLLSNLQGVSTN